MGLEYNVGVVYMKTPIILTRTQANAFVNRDFGEQTVKDTNGSVNGTVNSNGE